MVHGFLVVLPLVELALGLLITIGLFTRWALALGSLTTIALVFGTALRSDRNTLTQQMIYAIVYYLLLANRTENYFSIDTLLRPKSTSSETGW